jgi:GT2 family glycosyltransferase
MIKSANITVAVPTVDRPEALSRCLEGVFSNKVLPAEVIIIDQGQSEAAEQVIEHFRTGGMPIIHGSQERKGLSAARNLSCKLAYYPIIAFTDDDCVPDAGWIDEICQTFSLFPQTDGVTGRILPLGPEAPDRPPVSLWAGNKRFEFKGRAMPWSIGSSGNFAVKRAWLDRIEGYDEKLGSGSQGKSAEDIDLYYRLLRSGAIIRYEPKVMVYHKRQDTDHWISNEWNYGYGMGAFVGKYLRKGDFYTAYILGAWLFWQLGSFLVGSDRALAKGALLRLRGCIHGLAYGFKLG